jgi:small GTP-binding protein
MLATASEDRTVKIWSSNGELCGTLTGHTNDVFCVAFDARSGVLASGSFDDTIKVWEPHSGKLRHTLVGHGDWVRSLAFNPQNGTLASASDDSTVRMWHAGTGELQATLSGHRRRVFSVAFDPAGTLLASGSADHTVKIWQLPSGRLLRTLEGHTASVEIVAFSPDGRLLASKSHDNTIRLWSCESWDTVAVIPERTQNEWNSAGLAFHPKLPLVATTGSEGVMTEDEQSRFIHLWNLDYKSLLAEGADQEVAKLATHYTTGKIVLVGDHSVGKSALGYHLVHGHFKAQESTHGERFWPFPKLGKTRADGTECEAVLWDFAGQHDYRLVHALFVDNADLALVLFDSADRSYPPNGVMFWLSQLRTAQSHCEIILVASRVDRGSPSLTPKELEAFCKRNGIAGAVQTSAFTGKGIEELLEQMKSLTPWDEKAATVTTTTFKRIKDYVQALKETAAANETIITFESLRRRLESTDAAWLFTDAEMATALGHLENYGCVRILRTSTGEQRVLIDPEQLNNLAASFVLEARGNSQGLGALEEELLLRGGYDFPELRELSEEDSAVLLDSATMLFLEHNVCFRETDPLSNRVYLIFPELINLKRSPEKDEATEDGTAYTVSGATQNVFASLVVLLGHTHTFTRTAQWQNNARYEVGGGLACGFRLEADRDGEMDFVLCFGSNVGEPVRTLFQGLFESFLARRNLTVLRYEVVRCVKCGCPLDRSVVRQRLNNGTKFAFCNECGERLALPTTGDAIQLTSAVQAEVESQRRAAERRTRFEQAVFRIRAYISEQKIERPECFISYAWGVPEHERWVEKRLARDLQKAGIEVVLDRWQTQIGASLARFVDRIEECQHVIVVGTPLYRQKAKNLVSEKGSVVAAEYDVAGIRLLATEDDKRTVLPVLLAGDESESFPPLVRGRVYGDFRKEDAYFTTAFDLILRLYEIAPDDIAVADLRESLINRR